MGKTPRRVCLDTSVVIDYLRQTKETENLIEKLHTKFDEVALTAITVYELLLGVEYLGGRDRPEVEAIIKSSIILPLPSSPFSLHPLTDKLLFRAELKDTSFQ